MIDIGAHLIHFKIIKNSNKYMYMGCGGVLMKANAYTYSELLMRIKANWKAFSWP